MAVVKDSDTLGRWIATDDQKTVWLVGPEYIKNGRPARRVLGPDTLALLASQIDRAAAQPGSDPVEGLVFRRGNTYRVHARSVRGPRGDIAGFVGYVQLAEDEPLTPLKTGGWEWDVPAHTTWWTGDTYALYGEERSEGQQSAQEWTTHLDPSEFFGQQNWWLKTVEDCDEDGATRTNTLRMIRVNDHEDRVLAYGGRVFFDGAGHPMRYRGYSIDVTETVGTLMVAPTDPLLGALVTTSRDLFFVIDLRWREVVYRSRPVEPFFGRPLPSSGRLFELLYLGDREEVEQRLVDFTKLRVHTSAEWTFRLQMPDGELRTLTAIVTPVEANPLTHQVDQILCCVQMPAS